MKGTDLWIVYDPPVARLYRHKSEISCVSGAVSAVRNFHTEEVMLDKITGKNAGGGLCSPVVEGKVLRHRGGETRVLRPGYVKPKHEFNYQQAVERLPGEDRLSGTTGRLRRLRIITDNLKQEEHAIVQVEECRRECRAVWQIHHGRRPVREN